MKPLLLISVLAAGPVVFADTTSELELISNGVTVTVTDNEAGVDLNSANGTILYLNSNFQGWNISYVGGTSNSPGLIPFGIDTGGLVANCDAGFTCAGLSVLYSDVNFTQPTKAFVQTYSATISGAGAFITHQTSVDGTTNTLFAGVSIGTVT